MPDQNLAFGDLMALVDPAGNLIHLCVYVADNVVFTKNGGNPGQPWVLMKIPDMLPLYSGEAPLRMAAFRSHHPFSGTAPSQPPSAAAESPGTKLRPGG